MNRMSESANRENMLSALRAVASRQSQSDAILLDRALGILHRMATENTGWRSFFRRWYYSDEPLRNDAANLVREAGFGMMQPCNTRLVGATNAHRF